MATVRYFYVNTSRARCGPVPIPELQAKWDSGEVSDDTLVWAKGMGAWAAISSVPAFTKKNPAPISVPEPQPVLEPVKVDDGGPPDPVTLMRGMSTHSAFVAGFASGKHGMDLTQLTTLLTEASGAYDAGLLTLEQKGQLKDLILGGDLPRARAVLQLVGTTTGGGGGGDDAALLAPWQCASCTMGNEAMTTSCSVCGSPRADAQAVDAAVARKLQAEEEAARRAAAAAAAAAAGDNEFAECAVCLSEITHAEYVPMDSCAHAFHAPCLAGHITARMEARRFPVLCPIPECQAELTQADVYNNLPAAQRQRYQELSLQSFVQGNADTMSCCPTPDCTYAFAWSPGDAPQFYCPVCHRQYCLSCKSDKHTGYTCRQFQTWRRENGMADDLFTRFVEGQHYKQCPFCRFWVEKTEGCDHMSCRCGNEFCYACGGVYNNCECRRGGRRPRPRPHPRPRPGGRPVAVARGRRSRRRAARRRGLRSDSDSDDDLPVSFSGGLPPPPPPVDALASASLSPDAPGGRVASTMQHISWADASYPATLESAAAPPPTAFGAAPGVARRQRRWRGTGNSSSRRGGDGLVNSVPPPGRR